MIDRTTIIDSKINDYCLDAEKGVDNYNYACGYLKACETMGFIKFEKNLEYRCKLCAAARDDRVVRVNAEPYDEYEELDIPVRDIYVVEKRRIWLNDTLLMHNEQIDKLLEKIERYVFMCEFKCEDGGPTVWINTNYIKFLSEGHIVVGKWHFGGKFVGRR